MPMPPPRDAHPDHGLFNAMRPTRLPSASPALLIAALAVLPFLGKAFTIDDPIFLKEAEHVLVDPLHPTAFEYPWNQEPERVSAIVPTGPVGAWILVPAVLAGGSEPVAHLITLAFLWLAILATVSLGLQLGLGRAGATAAGLLLATAPAVLAMAGTAMPDVAAMALGVAGLDRLVAWNRDRRLLAALLAAILLGLAPLARTHLLLLLPLGALLLVDEPLSLDSWRGRPRSRWLPLAGAAALVWGGTVLTRDPGGTAGTIQGAVVSLSGLDNLPFNTVVFHVHWVMTTTLGLAWAILRWRALLSRWWLLVVGTAGAAFLLRLGHGTWEHQSMAPLAGLGLAVLADVVVDAWQRRDRLQAVLWLWLLLPLPAVIYVHFPAKYLLASAPAAALLVARRLKDVGRGAAWSVLGLSAVLGTLLGVAMLRADSNFGDAGREAAATLIAPRVASGEHVWFLGHWGFQWYAERAGGRFFSVSPPYPVPGDIVVSSRESSPQFDILDLHDRSMIVPLARVELGEPGGRIMSRKGGAGFYSNTWGYLPWTWSEEPIESYFVWRLVKTR